MIKLSFQSALQLVPLSQFINVCQIICRYGQQKSCYVYRFVMDSCLEKKIYDRQINKQGMSDRIVDECNPEAHLTIKDVSNLCWDNEDITENKKDMGEITDKYNDVVMQRVIKECSGFLSKVCKLFNIL